MAGVIARHARGELDAVVHVGDIAYDLPERGARAYCPGPLNNPTLTRATSPSAVCVLTVQAL